MVAGGHAFVCMVRSFCCSEQKLSESFSDIKNRPDFYDPLVTRLTGICCNLSSFISSHLLKLSCLYTRYTWTKSNLNFPTSIFLKTEGTVSLEFSERES